MILFCYNYNYFVLVATQTPHQQTDKLDLARNPDMISAGGGFGPVSLKLYALDQLQSVLLQVLQRLIAAD